jgi:hypothetical protein
MDESEGKDKTVREIMRDKREKALRVVWGYRAEDEQVFETLGMLEEWQC